MKSLLQKYGIKVVNNQISKADVEKAVKVIAVKYQMNKRKSNSIASNDMTVDQADLLRQIYQLVNKLEDESGKHLATNITKVFEVVDDEEFNKIDQKYKELV